MSQNSNNQDYSNETDGFILGGGTTKRDLTVTGADITLTGSGTNTYTMPSSTDTLVGRASTDTLTNKTLTSPVVNTPTGIVKGDVGLGNVTNNAQYYPGGTDVAVADGGTGSSTTSGARTNLGVTDANYKNTNTTKGDVGLGNVDNTSNATERAATATLANKTLTTPTISATGFTNAQHNHSAANRGGQIAISDTTGTLAVARGGTGATTHTSGNFLKGAGTGAVTSSTAAAVAAEIGALLFPVGSYYMNETNATNPGTLLGFGTWVAVADKMIVGKGSGTFATAGSTGGAETHNHTLSDVGYAKADPDGAANTLHTKQVSGVTSWSRNVSGPTGPVSSSGASGHTDGIALGGVTDSGSSLPPYIVAYIWERTA